MKFDELKFNDVSETFGNNAIQAIVDYPGTDYEMSVVRHAGSYGFELHRYELGVFNGNNMVSYPPITHEDDQVRGYLKQFEVEKYVNMMGEMLGVDPKNKD